MEKTRSLKHRLISALLVLVMTISSLVSTTFAWFTDEVTSMGNTIESGSLKVDLLHKVGADWVSLKDKPEHKVFDYDKWEPGFTLVETLKVQNLGSLALKYRLSVEVEAGTAKLGENRENLADVIDVWVYYGETSVSDYSAITATGSGWVKKGTLSEAMKNPSQFISGNLLPTGKVSNDPNVAVGNTVVNIALHMQESAGNEYQGLSVGDIYVNLLATQLSSESDSFGNDYDNDAEFPSFSGSYIASAPVELDGENRAVSDVILLSEDGTIGATVPAGTLLKPGTEKLTLNVTTLDKSESNIVASENQNLNSIDVHVNEVAEGNTTPIIVTIEKLLAPGLNMGNYELYHVEDGVTVPMTHVVSSAELDVHNEFTYDPATGDVNVAMASFSEVATLADKESTWEGGYDYTWYDANATELKIANADQLAGLSAIVGGMAKIDGNGVIYTSTGVDENVTILQDGFKGKTVKLIADINIGDTNEYYDDASENGIVFYPIGYWNSDETYERTNNAISSGFYSFEGTFDGNGNTISNFYQNTWEMKGDHNWYDATLQYYRDGMGLFGKIYGGTVKNLTVDNFSSDGEITTTGTIAAYAEGATFENIAIFNCNPRVYNIGNGGIVGCVGWYAKDADLKTTFTNITVDNSNKISALWGSYDVACGGIVGQYYPTSGQSAAEYPVNAGIHFENCHVSAQMDVYNDVCANYQYYAYRYTGMFIGSIRENLPADANGHVYPNMNGITASGCTVHFGDWNDYYYCELVANSLASYTHDHQMSRLEQVASVDVENKTVTDLEGKTTAIPTSGRVNYVVVKSKDANSGKWIHGDGHDYAECYHFVNGVQHKHDVADTDNPNPTEMVNGVETLKEDKQLIYREFNQLFTGYGWGVTSKGLSDYEGVENMDITEGHESSVEKFAGKVSELSADKEYKLGDIFDFVDNGVKLVPGALSVGITNLDENNPVSATIDYDRNNWENSTITFTGAGDITITIQDYYFCTPTIINVSIKDREPEVKFETKFKGDFLYRVGSNSGSDGKGNIVKLNSLFKAMDGANIGNVSVTVEAIGDTTASGIYASNATWTNGTITFSGTGVVKVTITDDDYCIPTELYLEVVDAVNVTGATSATSYNVVLLNDAGLSSLSVSGRYAFYGNGFTLTYTGNGQYLNNGLKQGVVNVSENGTLDNVRIIAPIYPMAFMYYGTTNAGDYVQQSTNPREVEGDKTRYYYQLSTVAASGNATISNCYIYGGRNNIFVNTGDVTIKDTVLECGVVANVQIQSNASHTVTINNLTTIQYQVHPTLDNPNTTDVDETDPNNKHIMLGAGIIVGPETTENPKIVLNDSLKQYNWVTEDDKEAASSSVVQMIIETALNTTAYNHTVNNQTASNLGIIYMNEFDVDIYNNTGLPYYLERINMTGAFGQVYSLQGATSEQIYSDYANADKSTVNGLYKPQFKYDSTLGGQYIEKDSGDEHCYREGDTIYVMFPSGDTKELDIAALVNIAKYTGQDLGLVITVKDSSGNAVAVTDGKITLSVADEYTVTYTVTDTLFYDKDGNLVTNSIEYSWDVTISISLKDKSVPDAEFEFVTDNQKMGYYKPAFGDVKQYIPFLAGLKIYDYIGQERYLRFDGDADFNKIASIEVTNKYSGNDALIKVTLTDGGVITLQLLARADSGGGSDYTGAIKTKDNVVYFVNNGGTSNKDTTTTAAYWYVDYYKFVGNNGVEKTSAQQTFNSVGSSASTPSSSFSTTIKYTVTYNKNGGDCGQTTGYATSASAAVTLPTPTRSGYIFAGWYTAESGGTKVGGAGDSYTPDANITLYAQWGLPCTVTYNANGGSCGTASEKYTGTALTLPTATRDGYWFIGWYDAATGGNKIGDAGATYNPNGEITLYAQWQEQVEYTVTYDANGGSCGTTSATYEGTALTLPTPNRVGYTFNGWYTAASGGTKVDDAGATYTPSANITLYAQWTVNSYTITVTTSNASISGVTNGQSVAYGTTVSLTVSFDKSNSKTFTVTNDATGATILSQSDAGTYTFTMPDSNITINASSTGCFAEGTLITLADGTQKPIEQITYEDELLAWDFNTGAYVVTVPSLIESYEADECRVINLMFADGTIVRVIVDHGFFDVEANKFVFINEENVESYVGHQFVKVGADGTYENVELLGYEVTVETVSYYTIQTAIYNNCIAENMFTLTSPPDMIENDEWFDYFEIGEGMKYDEEKMQADIEKYGLYTYEDFAEYVTYEQFIAFNGPYLKVLVGRGVVTYEQIIELISIYVNP